MRELPEKTQEPKEAEQKKMARFYVMAPKSIQLAIQQEAACRNVPHWELGGIVLERWVLSGCPDFGPQKYQPKLNLPSELILKPVESETTEG